MKTRDIRLDRPPEARSPAKKSAVFPGKSLGTLVLPLTALLALTMALLYPVERDCYQRVHVQDALRHAMLLASAIQDYHQANKRYPEGLDDLHAMPERPIEVRSIAFDGQTGIIRVHVADVPRDEGAFELVPSVEPAGRISRADSRSLLKYISITSHHSRMEGRHGNDRFAWEQGRQKDAGERSRRPAELAHVELTAGRVDFLYLFRLQPLRGKHIQLYCL